VCRHDIFLCHLLPVGQWQSLRQQGGYAVILFFKKNKVKKAAKVAAVVRPSKSGGHKHRSQRTKAIIYTASAFGVSSRPSADDSAFFFFLFSFKKCFLSPKI